MKLPVLLSVCKPNQLVPNSCPYKKGYYCKWPVVVDGVWGQRTCRNFEELIEVNGRPHVRCSIAPDITNPYNLEHEISPMLEKGVPIEEIAKAYSSSLGALEKAISETPALKEVVRAGQKKVEEKMIEVMIAAACEGDRVAAQWILERKFGYADSVTTRGPKEND